MKHLWIALILGGFSTKAMAGTEIGLERPCGLGAVVGQPTGLSGKCYIKGRRFGWDAQVAYLFNTVTVDTLYVHTTAQWHPMELVEEDWGDISWYVGVGPFITLQSYQFMSSSTLLVGVRTPVGLSIDFTEYPVQVFVEAAVSTGLFSTTQVTTTPAVYPGGGVGARYYF